MTIVLGIAALLCWILFWIFFLSNLHLTYPALDMPVRFTVIAAVLMNMSGTILEIVKLRKKRNWLSSAGRLAVHIVPLFAFVSFYCWLAFGHWI